MQKNVRLDSAALEHLSAWVEADRTIAEKIFRLIKDIQRNPFQGIGKPEPLKGDYKGYWSRRITDGHRLIYKVTDTEIIIASCKGHYE